jgi:phage tail sheath protein FI
MPEYLAPGVYVEEVDTGAKPIEGVSTSTAAMVGVAERGPVDVPVLVTSVGEYARWFGGRLRAGDDYGAHRFLPHAVEGFFTNGGRRTYVVRVLDGAATRAGAALFDRGDETSVSTTLLRAAGEGSGSGGAPPPLVVLPSAGLGANDWVRIGDGSTAEYRQASGAPAATATLVPVDLPLARSHPAGETAEEFAPVTDLAFTLEDASETGDTTVVVRGASADVNALAADLAVEVGAFGTAEYRLVRSVSGVTLVNNTDSTARVRLDAPLVSAHDAGSVLSTLDFSAAAVQTSAITSASAGAGLFYVDDTQGNLDDRGHLVVVGTGTSREVRRIGELDSLSVVPGAVDDYPAGSLVEAVEQAPRRTLSANAAANDTEIVLQAGETEGIVVGQRLVIDPDNSPQTVTVQQIDAAGDTLTVTALTAAANANDEVVPAPKTTTAAASAGAPVIAVDDRIGLAEGAVVRIGNGAGEQLVTVVSLPALTGVSPDAGNVVVTPPLVNPAVAGTAVSLVGDLVPTAGRQVTAIVLAAAAGSEDLLVGDGDSFAQDETIRVTTPGGDVSFHSLSQNAAGVAPEELTLTTPLARSHPAGSSIVQRSPLIDVEALDAGSWGNRLRVSLTDDAPGLVARTTLATIVNATTVRLASRAGVQAGTVLELSDPATGAVVEPPVKVRAVDRTTGNILLAGTGLSPGQQVAGTVVRSREFTLDVLLLRQPDPATPSRNDQVIDRETFRNLSLDPRHSNYIEKVVGDIDGALRRWDHRPEGSSLYIRVRDRAANPAAAEATRLGPETLTDLLPDGRRVPARLRLEAVVGDDSIGTLTDDHYLGADNADPELRTGLQSLRNIEDVSIVGVPGRSGSRLQQGVVDHCELMRYRFAVLDSTPEPLDTIADAQTQRQQFDTKYAALYYPWLAVPDPFPENLADVRDYAIPPTGHVLGIYARTDIERGVHKAPANEVVRGITGLRRKVNKEQQDILNPYPVNVNVIRDFRHDNRGIRVYGGRVITSDPDWKYVNVRRLLIFIEASIDRGLQWVVFEPNSEPLWARVQRTITNFLTVVWRSGALEGTSPEEAFFVRCDRTTMTQAEIDNGRLIVQVGVAPVKPAEFVIVRIGLWTARSDS